MKGIILAGGSGTRLYPATKAVSKQLLLIYDKPMIYYPLSVLMLADIKDILIISTPNDILNFEKLLGTGEDIGINISYAVQNSPDGLAQAFLIGEEFIGKDDVCLILGDNIFYGAGFKKILKDSVKIVKDEKKAVLFGYHVDDPQRYGVAEFDLEGNVITLQEKPKNPKSNIAVTGLYFYPNNVISFAKKVKPSKRGELEITSLNQVFLKSYKLFIKNLSRGFAWFDTGTIESMSDASEFVKSVEKSTSLKIACLEEIAYIQNWISVDKLKLIIGFGQKSNYHNYLRKLLKQN